MYTDLSEINMLHATHVLPQSRVRSFYRTLPEWAWWIVATGIVLGLVSPHPFLSVACWLALPLLVRLTWRSGEPPLAFIGVLLLWVDAVLPVIYFSGFKWIPLPEVASTYATRYSTTELHTATWLALAATLVTAAAIRLALNNLRPVSWQRLRQEVMRLDPQKLFYAYLAGYALNFVFGGGRLLGLGGLAQLTIAFTLVRWAFFFLLAATALVQKRGTRLLALAIGIEITFGLLGFWGSFKDFFFIFVAAYLFARPNISFQETWVVLAVFLVVFCVGLFWQVIKSEYRTFLQQSPNITIVEEVNELRRIAAGMSARDLTDAMDQTVERIAVKTYFFGEVIEYIPEYRPYDGGAGWRAGLEHILKPRIFFPDKPSLHASDITNRYIGRTVAGGGQGASFAIGYFGESYADFGPVGMFIPVFLVGLMLGLMFRFFVVYPPVTIMGFALAAAFLPARIGGLHDVPQMLGWSITHFVAMALILIVAGGYLYKLFQYPDVQDPKR